MMKHLSETTYEALRELTELPETTIDGETLAILLDAYDAAHAATAPGAEPAAAALSRAGARLNDEITTVLDTLSQLLGQARDHNALTYAGRLRSLGAWKRCKRRSRTS